MKRFELFARHGRHRLRQFLDACGGYGDRIDQLGVADRRFAFFRYIGRLEWLGLGALFGACRWRRAGAAGFAERSPQPRIFLFELAVLFLELFDRLGLCGRGGEHRRAGEKRGRETGLAGTRRKSPARRRPACNCLGGHVVPCFARWGERRVRRLAIRRADVIDRARTRGRLSIKRFRGRRGSRRKACSNGRSREFRMR